ncbi:hypothetical protein JYP51_09375 [Ponticoccus gilvus]|nr:hypothetical protein [Enemella evansiae]
MTELLPVHIAPVLALEGDHVGLELPSDLTVAEIIARAMPGLSDSAQDRLRVILVTSRGMQTVPRDLWPVARPRPGVRVVLRLVPGDGAMRSVLQIVVAVAAVALSAAFAPALAGAIGISTKAAAGFITLGTTAIGNLLIQSMFPPPEPRDRDGPDNRYSIGAVRNELRPDGVIPEIMGTVRYTPPLATSSWSEIVGDDQIVHYAVNFGGGHVELSDIRLGDTPIDTYDEIETELHVDRPASDQMGITPMQVFEKAVGAELKRPYPTDDAGNRIDGEPIATPIVRRTGKDAAGVGLIFYFPNGLVRYTKEGDPRPNGIEVRIRQRQSSLDEWEEVETVSFRAEKEEAFFRQVVWDLPYRGRWQIEVTKMDGPPRERYIENCTWSAIQTLRPEAPIAYPGRITKLALRARATAQFNGQIDQLSALCQRIIPDWDAATETWIPRATSNPASHFRAALQSTALAEAEPDSGIDLERLQYWHAFCARKDLKFDFAFEDDGLNLRNVLDMIAAAGRATPRRTSGRWDVVIDEPRELVAGHINLRNARELTTTRSYLKLPHAFRVPFLDATNDYRPDERLVRRPGYEGPITLTELLEMPGKTDPAEVAREATRRFYELQFRPDVHQAMQDHEAMPIERGDLVMFSNPILSETQGAGRVRRVDGGLVLLDEPVLMTAGEHYVIRFLVSGAPDAMGFADAASVVRQVRTSPGETRLLEVLGPGDMPEVGQLVQFGLAAADSFPVKVQAIEMGEHFSTMVRMVAHAPEIDTLTDAYVAPPWTGRVGADVGLVFQAPSPPRFTGIESAIDAGRGYDDMIVAPTEERPVSIRLTGGYSGGVLLTGFQLFHRLVARPEPADPITLPTPWELVAISAAAGGTTLEGYLHGDGIEIYATAIALGGAVSPPTPVVAVIAGAQDPDFPSDLSAEGITAVGQLGHAVLTVPVPSGSTDGLQIYRVPAGGALDRDEHALGAPVPVTAGNTATITDGDATRSDLVTDGDLDDAGAWTADGGWTVSSGAATHAPGGASVLSQALATSAGIICRGQVTLSGRTAGSVTLRLAGGTPVATAAISSNGQTLFSLTTLSQSTDIEIEATPDFDGAVESVTLIRETASCAVQGAWDYYAEPRAGAIAGAMAGPASAVII